MSYSLTKLLPLLLMPLGLGVFLLLLAFVLVYRHKRGAAMVSIGLAILLLVLPSLPTVASALIWSLESQYPARPSDSFEPAECIIVLGGTLGADVLPRQALELTDSSDRVYHAASLYRLGKARSIIVAAGNQPWQTEQVAEADQVYDLLVEWGVPPAAIVLDTLSKNTRENAVNAAALMQSISCEKPLLVTSGWHMPRAVASFRQVGVDVIPVSVDIRFVQGPNGPFSQFVPRADALATASLALREWMGIWFYRLRGWI